MLLGYPLDYRNLAHIDHVVASFGKMIHDTITEETLDMSYLSVCTMILKLFQGL
jgi:hypothetical protein